VSPPKVATPLGAGTWLEAREPFPEDFLGNDAPG
jgi:hypothetical protein